MPKGLLGAIALSCLMVGCGDPSKAELESTKQQLTTVTAERDALNTQLEDVKTQLTAAQAAAAAAAPAPAAPVAAEPAPEAAPAEEHKAAHHAAKPSPAAEEKLQEGKQKHRSM